MKKLLLIGTLALGLAGCSLATVNHFLGNVSAADCATPASQQAFIGNLPQIAFLTNNQALGLIAQYCTGVFGTVAGPTPAPGMSGIFSSPTPKAPSPSPTPSAAPSPTAK